MLLSNFVNELAVSAGVQVDILKTVVALLTSFLLSPLFRFTSTPFFRNSLSISIGLLLIVFILQEWSLFILSGIIVPFILIKLLKHPLLVSVICSLILLLMVHGYRFVYLYSVWKVDCSVYVMLLVTKLTYFGQWLQKQQNQADYTFWDYLGYNLYFPGVIVGPTFSFQTYLTFINNKLNNYQNKIVWLKALQPLFITIPLSALTIYLMPIFHPRWVLQNQYYLSLNIIMKIIILNLVGFVYRLKFYSAWYFGQAATNLSGLSLSSSGQYDAVQAVSLKFQFQPNPRNKTEHWNASMQQWLKKVVYESLAAKFGSNIAFLGTFLISAYWHGIYLTYYIGFMLWGLLLHITKWAYKWSQILPTKITNSIIFNILTWIFSATMMNYIGMFIVVLEWEDAVLFHSNIYHWGTILLVLLFVLSFVLRPPRQKSQQKKDQ